MRRFTPLLAVLFCVSGVRADEAPRKVAAVEGVTEYRLANGARVLLFPEASRPTVTVNLTVLVGSRHEGYGETGMAQEHMVFKGTPGHPNVPKALRDHGASFNGTTNSDRTNYFETLPARWLRCTRNSSAPLRVNWPSSATSTPMRRCFRLARS